MSIDKKNILAELQGLQLSSVEFVQDYFQLRFDGPVMTIYNPTTIELGNIKVKSWADQFRNVICGQITKVVKKVDLLEKDSLVIEFEDKSRIIISLKEEDYQYPEAINYHGLSSNYLVVF